MDRMRRQKPFLESILREANNHKRKVMLEYANKDQINAVSELVLNTLKKRVPVSSATAQGLKPYKHTLRRLAKRKTSLKARRALLANQKGGAFWKGLDCCHRRCPK